MTLKTKVICGLLAVAYLPGCGASSPAEGTDGSTHWLKGCSDDADCVGNLLCLCGACTQDCSTDAACDAASEGVASQCLPLACDGAPSGGHACHGAINLHSATRSSVAAGETLGAACIPADEYDANFGGFHVSEVNLAADAQCAGEPCLVNMFQGRVTCPYGQSSDDEGGCLTADGEQGVGPAVAPQLAERPASDAVYCSCRCDGPDPSAEYCACGAGFECTPLIDVLVPGSGDWAGSYCTKAGTTPETPLELSNRPCDANLQSCAEAEELAQAALVGAAPPQGANNAAVVSYIDQVLVSDETACLPRPLPLQRKGAAVLGAACVAFEAVRGESDLCERPGRLLATNAQAAGIRARLEEMQACKDGECTSFQICELVQLYATDGDTSCLDDEVPSDDGWCYVQPSLGLGDPALVQACPDNSYGKIRWAGEGAPVAESLSFLACVGER